MIPKDNPLKGMASEIEAPLQAANSNGLCTTNSVIKDQAPEVPIVREQRDRFYQIFWHKISQTYYFQFSN
jgi:hypothetical protein